MLFRSDLSRHGESGNWSQHANAGLERLPLTDLSKDAPYVIKSPWAGEYIDQILNSESIEVDALVTPMRDLVEAATSRSILEHHAIHRQHGWMANDLDCTWEVFGHTPGGSVFSLNPLDQARLLAVSFHRLIHSAASHDVPVITPAFPRMVTDADYLFRTLRSILPSCTTLEQARSAHSSVAAQELVRVAAELQSEHQTTSADANGSRPVVRYPAMAQIDNIALRREISELRRQTEQMKATVAAQSTISSPFPAAIARSGLISRLRRLLKLICRRPFTNRSNSPLLPDVGSGEDLSLIAPPATT